MAGLAQNKIRIRLKAYDHSAIEMPRRRSSRPPPHRRIGDRARPAAHREERLLRDRSPFKDKDSREHFEIRTHKRLIDIHQPTPKTVDSLQRLDHLSRA